MDQIELKLARAAAEEFCAANLRECCAELIEWQNTALLRDGKVRQLADLCRKYIGEHDALKLAERMVQNQACETVATPSSSHPAEGERQSIDTPEFQMLFGALATASINAMTSGNDPDLKRHHEVAWDALIAHIDTWAGHSAGKNMVVAKQPEIDAKTAETRMDSGFDGGGQIAGSAGDAVPAGFKLVPIEPTREMLKAGVRCFQTNYDSDDTLADWRAAYVTMLAAAPAADIKADAAAGSARQGGITSEESQDAERFRKAIAAEDAAESLYAAVLNNAPDTAAIRREFDAAPSAHLVEQVGEQIRRKAPWPDFRGNPIHEGDTIKHPTGARATVVCYDGETDPGDQWRADYGDGLPSRLVLQIGDKGRAVVVGQDSANKGGAA